MGPADPGPKVQPRQNTVVEKSADVLQEIWRTADHNRSKATFTLRSGWLWCEFASARFDGSCSVRWRLVPVMQPGPLARFPASLP